jgi:hypothetical protein
MPKPNRYSRIIEHIFNARYSPGIERIDFVREDFIQTAQELNVPLPKNLGDILYSFRYRALLPEAITKTAPQGYTWIIRPSGRARYSFVLSKLALISPNSLLAETKIADATPGIVSMYSFNDEQALLARLRYNRLVDIFTGKTCYSLQNHLRTAVSGLGQIETDEIYVGVDRRGAHYVFPVQAKGGADTLSIVQIEQDFALCEARFPDLICCPIAAQFMTGNLLALFEFEKTTDGIAIVNEKHYRLVPPDQLSPGELELYRSRPL